MTITHCPSSLDIIAHCGRVIVYISIQFSSYYFYHCSQLLYCYIKVSINLCSTRSYPCIFVFTAKESCSFVKTKKICKFIFISKFIIDTALYSFLIWRRSIKQSYFLSPCLYEICEYAFITLCTVLYFTDRIVSGSNITMYTKNQIHPDCLFQSLRAFFINWKQIEMERRKEKDMRWEDSA